jgi:ABC-type Fe3+ transport system permease subunit/DNA-binding beta-propeller fold protein YncE
VLNWPLLQNSLLVSALTTLVAVGFGFAAALWLAGLEANWRKFFLALSAVALALPPFLVTNCWLDLLGHTGKWRGWLPLNIYSLGGTVAILALMLWPVTTFATLGAWQRLQPEQFEVDSKLRGWALLRWLLLPAARSALGQAAVLTFVLALNNFAVPAILQTKVFPAEVWVSFNTTFDYGKTVALSWPLVVVPLLLLIWLRRREVAWPRMQETVPAKLFRRILGTGWFTSSAVVTVFVLLLSVGLPLADLLGAERTWQQLWPAFAAGQSAFWNSISLAVATATLTVALGLLCWRWPVGTFLWLPFLVPGVVLGITLIFLCNRSSLTAFYQSAGIVVLAWTIRYLAIGWNGAAQARRSVDRELADAARLAGANRWQVFRHAYWPQIAPAVAAAWYVTYLLCLWDVETLVLVVPPGGETLALRIFNLLHYGHNAQVNALCALLLVLAVFPLAVWWFVNSLRSQRMALLTLGLVGLVGCVPPTSNETAVQSQLFDRVQIIGSRGTGAGQFNKPRSLVVDRQDNLYVVDMTGRVQKFSSNGVFLFSWQMPQTDLGKPKGMCLDGDGNIVVIEPHYARVNHYDTTGKLVAQWGVKGTNAGQIGFPRAVAVNSRGELFVSEYSQTERVQRFAAHGVKFLDGFGQMGDQPGEFNRAEGLCVDRRDQLYVADSCNHRVQVFSGEGKFVRAFGHAGSGRGELSYPYDLRVDVAGRVIVCEFGNSRIQIFDEHGEPLEILGGTGAAPGQFANPWSIALDSAGNLYVADSQNHRVQKLLRKKSVVSRQSSVVASRKIARALTSTDHGLLTTGH